MKAGFASECGTSFVELITSMLFLSVLMVMSYSFARAAFTNVRVQETKSEAQEVTFMAVDLWTRDVRSAGFSAAGVPLISVRAASAERVEVAADLDGDGDTDEANELIAYGYNEEKQQLTRATGGGSPQPLVRNVPPGGVRFTYFDANGAEIPAGAGNMLLEERQRIRRIDAWLRTEYPDAAGPLVTTASSTVSLRNP